MFEKLKKNSLPPRSRNLHAAILNKHFIKDGFT